jgi:hypothetical protein
VNSASRIRDQKILGLVMSELRDRMREIGYASDCRCISGSWTGTNVEDGLTKNGEALVTADGTASYFADLTTKDESGGPSMRTLVVTENITLDGVIDATEGWFAPAGEEDVDQSDLNEALRQQAAAANAVLLGRVTFEEMRGFWPLQTNDETGVSTSTASRSTSSRAQ